MKVIELVARGTDGWGQGKFGASRGNRTHKGVDLMCYEGSNINSHVEGVVTKLGYPYGDDLSYRYVEITDRVGLRHRFFYVSPWVKVGAHIEINDVIGECQDIQKRYRARKPTKYMVNHVHYEILRQDDSPIDPEAFLC